MSFNSMSSLDHQNPNKLKSKSRLFFMSPKHRRQKTNSSIEFVSRNSGTLNSFRSSQFNFQDSNPNSLLEETKPIFYPFPIITYDPNKIPPNLDWSIRHGIAHRVAPLESLVNSNDICESTGVPYTRNKLKLQCSLQKLKHIGPVFPMYFLMVKQIICIMLFLSLIAGGLGVIQYYEAPFKSYHHYIRIIMEDLLQFRILIYGSFSVIILLFGLMYKFRKDQKQLKLICKEGNRSPSDYTLMVSDLDGPFNEEEIKAFFTNYILQDFPLDVIRVTKTRDFKKYVDKVRDLSSVLNRLKAIKRNDGIESKAEKKLLHKIEKMNKYFISRKSILQNLQGLKRNSVWFVTFNTRNEAKLVRRKFEFSPTQRFFLYIFQKFSKDIEDYFLNGNFIKVEKAPEPSEIIWENLNSTKSSFCLKFSYAFLATLIILLTAAGIYGIKPTDFSGKKWRIAGIIAFTNELLYALVIKFSQWEKFKTITDKNLSITYKLIILQLLNMIVPFFAINLTIFQSQFDLNRFSFHLVCVGITCFLLPLLVRLINFKHLYKVLCRIKAYIQAPNNIKLTQDQLNQVFENPELSINSLYSHTIKMFLFSCFSFSISPGTALIALAAFILTYWIDKFNLLRRSLLPSYMRSELSESLFEFMDFGLFLLALGKLAFYLLNLLHPDETSLDQIPTLILSISACFLTFCYMFLPNKKLSRACLPVKKNDPSWICNLFYQQAFELFPSDYHSANPTVIPSDNSQKLKEDYKEIVSRFNGIEILQECPELLPIFAYAERYPTFPQINKRNLNGLRNPYYMYPQNYWYGLVQLISLNAQKQGNKIPLLLESHTGVSTRVRVKGAKSEHISRSKMHNKTSSVCPSRPSSSRRSETHDLKSIIREMSRMMYDNKEEKSSNNIESFPCEEEKKKNEVNMLNNMATDMSMIQDGENSLGGGSMILGMSPICGKHVDNIDLDESIGG